MTPSEIQQLADAIAERLESRAAGDVWLDAPDAAEVMACSVPTIERRTKSGELPSVKFGRLRRYRRSVLLAMADEKRDHSDGSQL